jgi:hypothetical protein
MQNPWAAPSSNFRVAHHSGVTGFQSTNQYHGEESWEVPCDSATSSLPDFSGAFYLADLTL